MVRGAEAQEREAGGSKRYETGRVCLCRLRREPTKQHLRVSLASDEAAAETSHGQKRVGCVAAASRAGDP